MSLVSSKTLPSRSVKTVARTLQGLTDSTVKSDQSASVKVTQKRSCTFSKALQPSGTMCPVSNKTLRKPAGHTKLNAWIPANFKKRTRTMRRSLLIPMLFMLNVKLVRSAANEEAPAAEPALSEFVHEPSPYDGSMDWATFCKLSNERLEDRTDELIKTLSFILEHDTLKHQRADIVREIDEIGTLIKLRKEEAASVLVLEPQRYWPSATALAPFRREKTSSAPRKPVQTVTKRDKASSYRNRATGTGRDAKNLDDLLPKDIVKRRDDLQKSVEIAKRWSPEKITDPAMKKDMIKLTKLLQQSLDFVKADIATIASFKTNTYKPRDPTARRIKITFRHRNYGIFEESSDKDALTFVTGVPSFSKTTKAFLHFDVSGVCQRALAYNVGEKVWVLITRWKGEIRPFTRSNPTKSLEPWKTFRPNQFYKPPPRGVSTRPRPMKASSADNVKRKPKHIRRLSHHFSSHPGFGICHEWHVYGYTSSFAHALVTVELVHEGSE